MATIGVFDSGVGGLTVLQALRRRMPAHNFIYLGDTARVPYGRKPPEMVVEFAREIAGFLCAQGVERLVVACNTASAVALAKLEELSPVPVCGVIDPGVSAATHATRSGRVGVIGTKATIGSGAYQRRLEAAGLQVWARACPMLVHTVEEGLADSPEAELLVRHYLADRPDIDTLILGCTHYPLLRAAIQRVAGDGVTLVDSAEATAEVVSRAIGESRPAGDGTVLHYVTGDSAAFAHTAQVIGGVAGEIRLLAVTDLRAQWSPEIPAATIPLSRAAEPYRVD
ncbi:MAG TPA: glutamate racemase [Bryobacteraceae bacterium]|jgi:glutamate racemase|nr:glutamate racemase [Bryobacteraceae bacterium]